MFIFCFQLHQGRGVGERQETVEVWPGPDSCGRGRLHSLQTSGEIQIAAGERRNVCFNTVAAVVVNGNMGIVVFTVCVCICWTIK